jgi:hypothetical protein
MLLTLIPLVSAEIFTYSIGDYEKSDRGEYSLVYINNGELLEEEGMLYQPVGTETFQIAHNKAIKSVNVIERNSPVRLKLNLPQLEFYDDDKYRFVERECFPNTREAWIDYTSEYGQSPKLTVEFYPLEMQDCKKGEFILYQGMKIEVEYYETNKIKSVTHSEINPGEDITFLLQFENIDKEGEVVIYNTFDPDTEIEREVTSEKISAVLTAPSIPIQEYVIEYYEGYEIVDRAVVMEDHNWGSIDFRVLTSDKKTVFPLAIESYNRLKDSLPLDITIKTIDPDTLEDGTTIRKRATVPMGKRIFYVDLEISENEMTNDIHIAATYNGITEYAEHNSLIRFKKEDVKRGLPKSPGEELLEEMAKASQDKDKDEAIAGEAKLPSSSVIGIIITIALFAIMGYFAYSFFRKED